jgi:hypothetical protein
MLVGFVAFVPILAHAQASITGVVRDASGAVLPGVTVQAESPVMIERSREVVTDGSGQYRIVDLRPGTYAVTYTLTGFSTVRREGIELNGSFVATIDVELKVGALQETITVAGESPIIDVQRTTQQRVFDSKIIEAIPAGRSHIDMLVLIPASRRRSRTRRTRRCRRHQQPAEHHVPDSRRTHQRYAPAARWRAARQRAVGWRVLELRA